MSRLMCTDKREDKAMLALQIRLEITLMSWITLAIPGKKISVKNLADVTHIMRLTDGEARSKSPCSCELVHMSMRMMSFHQPITKYVCYISRLLINEQIQLRRMTFF